MNSRSSQFFQPNRQNSVIQFEIPYIPRQVVLDDLVEDMKVLSKEQINSLEKQIQRERLRKEETGLPYTIISEGETFWAIYTHKVAAQLEDETANLRESKLLGEGKHGRVRMIQNLKTGKFYALKQQTANTELEGEAGDIERYRLGTAEKEFNILQKIGDSPQKKALGRRKSKNKETPGKWLDQYQIIIELAPGITMDSLTTDEIEQVQESDQESLQSLIHPALRLQMGLETLEKLQKLQENHQILHRDITPGNVIMDLTEQKVKLIDFGLSIETDSSGTAVDDNFRGSTIGYAPEIRKSLIARYTGEEEGELKVSYNARTESYAAAIMLADFYGLFLAPEADIPDWGIDTFIVKSLTSEDFEFNQLLPPEVLMKVLDVLHAMTAEETKRITIKEAFARFELIRKEFVESPDFKPIQTAVLSVATFLNASEEEQKNIVGELQTMDEVMMIDDQQREVMDYVRLKRKLEEAHLRVFNKVFIGSEFKEIMEEVGNYLKARPIPAKARLFKNEVVAKPDVVQGQRLGS